MRRTTFVRQVPALGAIALGGGFLAGCEESGLSPLTRAYAPIPPQTLAKMEAIGSSKEAPVLIRAYKKEAELEIWKMKADGHYAYLKSFPMCRWSGQLGPKVKEGDRQVPEGFYSIPPARMNPNSAYYLSFDVGYPNAYDRALGHTGGSIMVHGICSSAGCFSMTNEEMGEIYAITREAFAGGEHAIQMQSYPFRMTAENLAKYRLDPNIGFWKQLKEGSDNFQVTTQDVAVGVCNKHYVFNATPADGSHFDPTGPCPPLKRDDKTQREVAEKQKSDDAKIAELAGQGVSPVHTVYADGGQNPELASHVAEASRPEALTQAPVDIALDTGKNSKTKMALAAKPGLLKPAVFKTAASSSESQSAKPIEPVTVPAAPAEAEKPLYASLLSKLWGAKPAEAKEAPPQVPPAPAPAVAPPAATATPTVSAPLPPRRNGTSPAAAKPRESNPKPQNSVAAPASPKPEAALSPAESATRAVAFLPTGASAVTQSDH
jgi:murein L,D-transpeptidase YafK